ncbi:hypothetical protein D3C78_1601910 [compost metagenome]
MLHCFKPLRQDFYLAGAAHITRRHGFQLAQHVAFFQRFQIPAKPFVRDHAAIKRVVMRRIAEQHRWNGHHGELMQSDIWHSDTVAHAAVNHLRLHSNNIGLLRTGLIPK